MPGAVEEIFAEFCRTHLRTPAGPLVLREFQRRLALNGFHADNTGAAPGSSGISTGIVARALHDALSTDDICVFVLCPSAEGARMHLRIALELYRGSYMWRDISVRYGNNSEIFFLAMPEAGAIQSGAEGLHPALICAVDLPVWRENYNDALCNLARRNTAGMVCAWRHETTNRSVPVLPVRRHVPMTLGRPDANGRRYSAETYRRIVDLIAKAPAGVPVRMGHYEPVGYVRSAHMVHDSLLFDIDLNTRACPAEVFDSMGVSAEYAGTVDSEGFVTVERVLGYRLVPRASIRIETPPVKPFRVPEEEEV